MAFMPIATPLWFVWRSEHNVSCERALKKDCAICFQRQKRGEMGKCTDAAAPCHPKNEALNLCGRTSSV